MITRELSVCNRCLDFQPQKPWPQALPAFTWNSFLLAGFDRHEGLAVDLAESQKLIASINALYPQLGLAELARLYESLQKNKDSLNENLDWFGFFANYKYHYSESLMQVLLVLIQSPINFQNWCDEKKVSPRDLAILRSFHKASNFNSICDRIAQLNPSKTIGVQILEWSGELILTREISIEDLIKDDFSIEQWHQHLYQKRFPQTHAHDQRKNQQLSTLPKSRQVHLQWKRVGDRAGIEIKLFADSLSELRNRMVSLEKINTDIEENIPDLWN